MNQIKPGDLIECIVWRVDGDKYSLIPYNYKPAEFTVLCTIEAVSCIVEYRCYLVSFGFDVEKMFGLGHEMRVYLQSTYGYSDQDKEKTVHRIEKVSIKRIVRVRKKTCNDCHD